jgi:hypothetical protein
MQERTGLPATWTVQAPHWAMPHPNLVPVMPRTSRSTHRSGMSGGTSTSRLAPFTVKVIIGGLLLGGDDKDRPRTRLNETALLDDGITANQAARRP